MEGPAIGSSVLIIIETASMWMDVGRTRSDMEMENIMCLAIGPNSHHFRELRPRPFCVPNH